MVEPLTPPPQTLAGRHVVAAERLRRGRRRSGAPVAPLARERHVVVAAIRPVSERRRGGRAAAVPPARRGRRRPRRGAPPPRRGAGPPPGRAGPPPPPASSFPPPRGGRLLPPPPRSAPPRPGPPRPRPAALSAGVPPGVCSAVGRGALLPAALSVGGWAAARPAAAGGGGGGGGPPPPTPPTGAPRPQGGGEGGGGGGGGAAAWAGGGGPLREAGGGGGRPGGGRAPLDHRGGAGGGLPGRVPHCSAARKGSGHTAAHASSCFVFASTAQCPCCRGPAILTAQDPDRNKLPACASRLVPVSLADCLPLTGREAFISLATATEAPFGSLRRVASSLTYQTGVSQSARSGTRPRTTASKCSDRRLVTGPITPSPTTRRSTERTGVILRARPAEKHLFGHLDFGTPDRPFDEGDAEVLASERDEALAGDAVQVVGRARW